MKQNVNKSQFADAFKSAGRQDQFSYHGLEALFDFLEETEADTGEEFELDVIGLCCEFSEHESALACVLPEEDCLNGKESAALEYLRDNTQVIEFKGGIIIQNF
tara:strand:- start:210 stop:521 length:312 start_codon:yes stop_codon:yes gene_type:complete